MAVIFSGAGAANSGELNRQQISIINACIFALPAVSVVTSGIVILLYARGGNASCYWWHGVPILVFIGYIIYIVSLTEAT